MSVVQLQLLALNLTQITQLKTKDINHLSLSCLKTFYASHSNLYLYHYDYYLIINNCLIKTYIFIEAFMSPTFRPLTAAAKMGKQAPYSISMVIQRANQSSYVQH